MKEIAVQVVSDQRIAHVVALGTTGTGMATFLDYIPSDIGKLATILGMVLTIILIANHAMKLRSSLSAHKIDNRQKEIDLETAEIELDKLKKEVDG